MALFFRIRWKKKKKNIWLMERHLRLWRFVITRIMTLMKLMMINILKQLTSDSHLDSSFLQLHIADSICRINSEQKIVINTFPTNVINKVSSTNVVIHFSHIVHNFPTWLHIILLKLSDRLNYLKSIHETYMWCVINNLCWKKYYVQTKKHEAQEDIRVIRVKKWAKNSHAVC